MGLFDSFKRKSNQEPGSSPPPKERNLTRLSKVVGDRLAQTYDRRDAIATLSSIKTPEAATALLKRFTFYSDPSTDDQEEKAAVFEALVAYGDTAHEAVLSFCERAESLSWPLKILQATLSEEEYYQNVVRLLRSYDTDYCRNVDPKNQLLGTLEGHPVPEAFEAVAAFLEDVSEPVRFHATSTLISFHDDRAVALLKELVKEEESVRIRNLIAEGFVANNWPL